MLHGSACTDRQINLGRVCDRLDRDLDGRNVAAAVAVADRVGKGLGARPVQICLVNDLVADDARRAVKRVVHRGYRQRLRVSVGVVGDGVDRERHVFERGGHIVVGVRRGRGHDGDLRRSIPGVAGADARQARAELHVRDHVQSERGPVGRGQREAGLRNVVLANSLGSELDAHVIAIPATALHVCALSEVGSVRVVLVGDVIAGHYERRLVMIDVEEQPPEVGLQGAGNNELESNRPVADFCGLNDDARFSGNLESNLSHRALLLTDLVVALVEMVPPGRASRKASQNAGCNGRFLDADLTRVRQVPGWIREAARGDRVWPRSAAALRPARTRVQALQQSSMEAATRATSGGTGACSPAEPETVQQVHDRRVPSSAAAREHASGVQLVRYGPRLVPAGADVLQHRREVPRVPIGVPRDGGPKRRSAFARAAQSRRAIRIAELHPAAPGHRQRLLGPPGDRLPLRLAPPAP